ncbi:Metallo-dependent phosphatase-like protein [Scheffersomyces xylosifermentans]|uniref:Metallo-dependent phosphatase-like protein n=1 Tax=Scheffersomyces xylosifermentans TaxID=1304137 RepID=UPI00315DDB30
MSEATPLRSSKKKRSRKNYTDEEAAVYYEEEEMDHTTRMSIYAGAFFFGILTLWFFTIYLPGSFIPAATDLVGIQKITELDVTLRPINPARGLEYDFEDEEELNQELDKELDHELDQDMDQDMEITRKKGKSRAKSKRTVERIIMVGDIHGHYTQFRKLLKKINFRPKVDHLLVLGDFISKGPDSKKVLEYLIDNNIDCILGNHEYYILQNYAHFHGIDQPFFVVNGTSEISRENPFRGKDGFNDDSEFLLAKKLEPEHVKYINSCSLIKKLGDMPLHKAGKGFSTGIPAVAVHAGIRWDLELVDQDPIDTLEMRSLIGPYYNETTSEPDDENAVSWSKIFNLKQKEKEGTSEEQLIVYYGHDARRGLNLKPYSRGIDTGCDRGEKLTAMVVWAEHSKGKNGKQQNLYREEAVSVHC